MGSVLFQGWKPSVSRTQATSQYQRNRPSRWLPLRRWIIVKRHRAMMLAVIPWATSNPNYEFLSPAIASRKSRSGTYVVPRRDILRASPVIQHPKFTVQGPAERKEIIFEECPRVQEKRAQRTTLECIESIKITARGLTKTIPGSK